MANLVMGRVSPNEMFCSLVKIKIIFYLLDFWFRGLCFVFCVFINTDILCDVLGADHRRAGPGPTTCWSAQFSVQENQRLPHSPSLQVVRAYSTWNIHLINTLFLITQI